MPLGPSKADVPPLTGGIGSLIGSGNELDIPVLAPFAVTRSVTCLSTVFRDTITNDCKTGRAFSCTIVSSRSGDSAKSTYIELRDLV